MFQDIGGTTAGACSPSMTGLQGDGHLFTPPRHHEERQRLIRRAEELETVLQKMRVGEMQGAKNRDMTISLYQHKVNELVLQAAEKKGFEEDFRKAQQTLAEHEEARCQLEDQYCVLEKRSQKMESGLSEEIQRYEAAVRDLNAQMESAEDRHKATVDNFQLQLVSLTEEHEQLQQRLFETEEQGKIISAELHLLRRMQSGLDGSAQVATGRTDGHAEGPVLVTASSCGTVLSSFSTATSLPPTSPSRSSSSNPSAAVSTASLGPATGAAGRVPQWFAPWAKTALTPFADTSRRV